MFTTLQELQLEINALLKVGKKDKANSLRVIKSEVERLSHNKDNRSIEKLILTSFKFSISKVEEAITKIGSYKDTTPQIEELEFLKSYIPKQEEKLTEAELRVLIEEMPRTMDATIGTYMQWLKNHQKAPLIDMKLANKLVRELL